VSLTSRFDACSEWPAEITSSNPPKARDSKSGRPAASKDQAEGAMASVSGNLDGDAGSPTDYRMIYDGGPTI